METTTTIAKVNKVNILLIENGEKLVPIKPICEALGITLQGQIDKLKSDEILGSVVRLSLSTGTDGKQYEMFCIPFKFVFGWLFTINPKNVKPEAQESVIRYKLECYEALYKYFSEHTEFIEQRDKAIVEKMNYLEQVKEDFHSAKSKLEQAKQELKAVADLTYEQWKINGMQLKLKFEEE